MITYDLRLVKKKPIHSLPRSKKAINFTILAITSSYMKETPASSEMKFQGSDLFA